ncbi:hypothetical protein J3R73_002682 [Labrys monachus]|uniref:Acyltransferase 3 domain-containing protein n=1 Tax=Labrys monachus TaxID=217067 RepID=A0ABU0FE60_9HYPH|nr:hypothetical protein [Labrys monachus]
MFMVLNHVALRGGVWLVHVNHGELGYVQDAQGFVFLSGLMVGMVYSRRMTKQGFRAGALKMWRRALEIYRYTLGCLVGIVLLAVIFPEAQEAWRPWLLQLGDRDPLFVLAAALLVFQPTFMDILPQYILYMLVAPPLVWLCIQGRWRIVLFGSIAVWLAIQFGVHLPFIDTFHALAGRIESPGLLQIYFNLFAWQICFMSGLVLGALTMTGQIDWQRLMDPRRPALAWFALGVFLVFAALRLGLTFGVYPPDFVDRITLFDRRDELSFIYVANFAVDAYLIAWVLIAGPRTGNIVLATIATGLTWLFNQPFLRFIGRHSLQTYTLHVFLIYGIKALDVNFGPWTQATKTAVVIGAIASLALPALYRESRFFARKPASST